MKTKQLLFALLSLLVLSGSVDAAPVFSMGVDNRLDFQGVGKKTGVGSAFAAGDRFYGVVNLLDISAGTTSWTANNVSAPYDSVTGYFVSEIKTVSSFTVSGVGTFHLLTLGVASSDPTGQFSAADLAAGTIVKLYTDTATAYTSGGPVAADISHATDGSLWMSMGMPRSSGSWTMLVGPDGSTSASQGGFSLITNNTGASFKSVTDPACRNGGCLVDMSFGSLLMASVNGGWTLSLSGPGTMHPVPLPAAAWLLGSGLLGLFGLASRKRGAERG